MKKSILILAAAAVTVSACKKDKDPYIIVPPSSGSEKVVFNGLIGSEPGSVAGNSVYLDLSSEKTKATSRANWDLGFYNGNDYRVIINNTSSAGAKVLDKYDLSTVTAADTIGLTLAPSMLDPQVSDLAYFDNIDGDLKKTAIPPVSADESSNPVIILNRGAGGGLPERPWVKLRILRKGTGYIVHYAGINETSIKTAEIAKDDAHHFQYLSFDNGPVTVAPEKDKWDLVWSYSVFKANFGFGEVPYNFSDVIALNYLSGVQAAEKVYADGATAESAYTSFNKDSVAKVTLHNDRWTIGSSWRSTQPAIGARPDRFYVIKDADGNFYKLKCLSMGAGNDGGTRGKPEFKYALIEE